MRVLRPRSVFTGGSFQEGVVVVLDGDAIHDVTREPPAGSDIEDWGNVALLPGTVNAHGHAFQNLFKGVADDLAFDAWRDDVLYPLSAGLDTDAIYSGALFAFTEALLAGVTTTVDFFYLHDAANENADAVMAAAHAAGIRLVFARAFYDLDAATNAPASYREDPVDARERTRVLAKVRADDPLVSVQPAPHSLHACAPETVAVARDLAAELDTPWHLHLAEAAYEVAQMRERYGTTPVRLLAREGLLDERLVAIHAVWLDDEELDLVAAAGSGIVHCPGANAFLGDGMARLDEMVRRGIRVALGPDGGCANNRQSVFDEMRLASLLVKARLTDGAAFNARAALELGTVNGADLLRLPVGSIEPGMKADFVAVDLDDLSLQPPGNLEYHVVNSMQPTAIARVMVGGEIVVDRGVPVRIDTVELRSRIAVVTSGWTRPER